MKDTVWHYMDKSGWSKGPWTEEPDKMQFTDVETGYPCLIVRNHSGALCGYIGVPSSHPDHGIREVDADVHGGVTFTDFCQPNNKEHGICHIVEPGEDDKVWWIGFDCAHCFDICPGLPSELTFDNAEYRTIRYVQAECAKLARQLKERAV